MDDCAQGAHSRERLVDQKQTKDRVWGWASGERLHPSSPCLLSSLSVRFCELIPWEAQGALGSETQ